MKIASGIIAILLLIVITAVSCTVFSNSSQDSFDSSDVIRIHIRANSNENYDQSVKLLVRDAIIAYLTPLLEDCADKRQAYSVIATNIDGTIEVANDCLRTNNFDYDATVRLTREEFPTRKYLGMTFEGGEYDALIVELGCGEGDNWWCVAFPPLCFVPQEGDTEQNSEIKVDSIIRKWLEDREKADNT